MLCQHCVVGKTVPVIRLQSNRWELAKVKRYELGSHHVQFIDDDMELVVIDQAPFQKYLAYFRRVNYGSEICDLKPDHDPLRTIETVDFKMEIFPFESEESNPADWTLDTDFNMTLFSPTNDNDGETSSILSSLTNNSGNRAIEVNTKKMPHLWSPDEDQKLIFIVKSQPSTHPIKWSYVAKFIKDRTGKQCRERYVNHLKPQVKNDSWSPVEDAHVFRMFKCFGSKWALMAKLLRGRTDNSIKNRFHHIRRRLEKDLYKTTKKDVLIDQCDLVLKAHDMVPFVEELDDAYEDMTFGPFEPGAGVPCRRCTLIVPSLQTGHTICQSTHWCQACTKMPSYFCDSTLHAALLRFQHPVLLC